MTDVRPTNAEIREIRVRYSWAQHPARLARVHQGDRSNELVDGNASSCNPEEHGRCGEPINKTLDVKRATLGEVRHINKQIDAEVAAAYDDTLPLSFMQRIHRSIDSFAGGKP